MKKFQDETKELLSILENDGSFRLKRLSENENGCISFSENEIQELHKISNKMVYRGWKKEKMPYNNEYDKKYLRGHNVTKNGKSISFEIDNYSNRAIITFIQNKL